MMEIGSLVRWASHLDKGQYIRRKVGTLVADDGDLMFIDNGEKICSVPRERVEEVPNFFKLDPRTRKRLGLNKKNREK